MSTVLKVRRIGSQQKAASCYFRSVPADGSRKALVQITERCNLHCAHCFVSATSTGADMSLQDIDALVLPRLAEANVSRLTLTGGEPFAHPDCVEIAARAVEAGFDVGLCTNATMISDEQILALARLRAVHVNVSLDGFSSRSHGRFRGAPESFETSLETTRRLAAAGLLQGLLSTPHSRTTDNDYEALAQFGRDVGARYVLMNPIGSFGRGALSRKALSASHAELAAAHLAAATSAGSDLEIVPIRLGNARGLPLDGCVASTIIYVFVDGDVAFCPYLAFAARTGRSRHADREFMAGNILTSAIDGALDSFDPSVDLRIGSDPFCGACGMQSACGRGCPAAAISAGLPVGARDHEMCPVEG